MKATIVSLGLSLLASAHPIIDRTVQFQHPGRSLPATKLYILSSRYDSPPACAAISSSATISAPAPTETDASSDGSVDSYSAAASSDSSDRRRKRIAQEDLPSLAQEWQDLCLASGGDIFTNDPCVQLAGVGGINALLVEADPCDQQHMADSMIDFAKSSGITNKEALISYAIKYRQHARNAVEVVGGIIPSSLYCQAPPSNSELEGIFNEQLDGCDPGLFGSPTAPVVTFGSEGTCPYGYTADMSSCSCSIDGSVISSSTNSTSSAGDDTSVDSSDSTDSSEDSSDASEDSNDNTDSSDSSDNTDGSDDSDDTSDSNDNADNTDSSDDSSDANDNTDNTDSSDDSSADDGDNSGSSDDISDLGPDTSSDVNDISGDINDPAGRK